MTRTAEADAVFERGELVIAAETRVDVDRVGSPAAALTHAVVALEHQ